MKYVVCYESKSHNKRRFFVNPPAKNPKKDGKPLWSDDMGHAAPVTLEVANKIWFQALMMGYKGLKAIPAEPVEGTENGTVFLPCKIEAESP